MAQHCNGQSRIVGLMRAYHAGKGQVEFSGGVAVMQAAIIHRRIPTFAARVQRCVMQSGLRGNGVGH